MSFETRGQLLTWSHTDADVTLMQCAWGKAYHTYGGDEAAAARAIERQENAFSPYWQLV